MAVPVETALLQSVGSLSKQVASFPGHPTANIEYANNIIMVAEGMGDLVTCETFPKKQKGGQMFRAVFLVTWGGAIWCKNVILHFEIQNSSFCHLSAYYVNSIMVYKNSKCLPSPLGQLKTGCETKASLPTRLLYRMQSA